MTESATSNWLNEDRISGLLRLYFCLTDILSSSIFLQGVDQEILPCGRIDDDDDEDEEVDHTDTDTQWGEPENNDSSDIAKDAGSSQQRNRNPFQAKLCVGNHLDEGGDADGAGGGDDDSVGRTVEDGQEQGRLSRVWLVGVSK